MPAAFNWSPGGCCCVPPTGWFDVYQLGSQARFARRPTLRATGAASNVASDSTSGGIDWYITPSTTPSQMPYALAGFPAFGNNVWALEQRVGQFYVVCYDTLARTQLSVTAVPFFGLGQITPYFMGANTAGFNVRDRVAVSQSALMQTDGITTLWTIPAGGGLTTTACQFVKVTGTPANGTNEAINCFAWRNWPNGAGKRNVTVASQITESTLFRGDISVVGGFAEITSKQTVISGTSNTNYTWIAFDSSPTHWAGTFTKTATGGINTVQLMIDGALIQEVNNIPSPANSPRPIDYFGEPHVCHPHETLGDGWVAVPTVKYTTYPTLANPNGVLADPSHPWEIIFYHNGVESWRIPGQWPHPTTPRNTWTSDQVQQAFTPRVDKSGDRWLYVNDLSWGTRDSTLHDHWRHNGAAHWRTGVMLANNSGTNPDLRVGGPAPNFNRHFAVVQNSDDLENGLPLDFPPGSGN